MHETLKTRVRERLNALGLNPFEAARKAGFERSYVNDLLIGKKSTIRQGGIDALAEALQCDPDYLTGLQAVPTAGEGADLRMPLAGIVEAGAWRELGADPGLTLPAMPDPRYPVDAQETYIVRGDHAAGFGITDGSAIVVVGMKTYRDGDVVLVRREKDGAFELSIRMLAGGALRARPAAHLGQIAPISAKDAGIVGLVSVSYRVFGLPA